MLYIRINYQSVFTWERQTPIDELIITDQQQSGLDSLTDRDVNLCEISRVLSLHTVLML